MKNKSTNPSAQDPSLDVDIGMQYLLPDEDDQFLAFTGEDGGLARTAQVCKVKYLHMFDFVVFDFVVILLLPSHMQFTLLSSTGGRSSIATELNHRVDMASICQLVLDMPGRLQ